VRPGGGQWQARVIPSFRPILSSEGDLGRRGYGMYDAMNSIGANEIIIEAPEHSARPEDMGTEQVKTVLELYKQRVTEIQKDERIRHVLVCKNSGSGAGSGFTHQHSEIIATPIIPLRMKTELDGAKYHYSYKERCIYCDIIDEELRVGKRIITETERFLAFCPYAPKYPFEFWIAPRTHKCSFEDISPEEIDDLSGVLASTIKRMRALLGEPSYNYVVHTAPNRIPRRDFRHTLGDDFHWHIEVVPRLQSASGFEWGSGFYVVPTTPEDAAEFYRRSES
jgi:UDPglucose--hexose-1-phosphate uridylyltransferase